jgi:hypothetical protein
MNIRTSIGSLATVLAVVAVLIVHCSRAAAGTYSNSITIADTVTGTEFDDWIGIPTLTMDPVDNVGTDPISGDPYIDIANVQLANNDDFLFVHISYHTTTSTGTYIALDTDQDLLTGFDIYELGAIGSDYGYVNDFPFYQIANVYNANVTLTGGPVGGPGGNGGALIWPFWDQNGPDKELAIPRDLFNTFTGELAFQQDTIDIMIYTDETQGLGDITDIITYTFEPAPAGLPGDYNGNSVIDAADYTAWRDALTAGATELLNDSTPGVIDESDFTYWRSHFGETFGSGAGAAVSSAVPEPATTSLLAVATLAIGLLRRWR